MYSYSEILKATLKKIIFFGIPLLYFLMAVAFYLKTYDSAQIKITILHVGGLFLIRTWLVLKVEEWDFSFLKKNFIFILPLLLFLLSAMVSFSLTYFKYAAFNELIKRFIYCGLALIVISEFDSDEKLLRVKNWLFQIMGVIG